MGTQEQMKKRQIEARILHLLVCHLLSFFLSSFLPFIVRVSNSFFPSTFFFFFFFYYLHTRILPSLPPFLPSLAFFIRVILSSHSLSLPLFFESLSSSPPPSRTEAKNGKSTKWHDHCTEEKDEMHTQSYKISLLMYLNVFYLAL